MSPDEVKLVKAVEQAERRRPTATAFDVFAWVILCVFGLATGWFLADFIRAMLHWVRS